MKEFSVGKKSYDRQKAAAYAVYMMAGSYFKSCRDARGKFPAMRLHYAEMGREWQYRTEEKCLAAMERNGERFLGRLEGLRCEATCERQGNDLIVKFATGGFEEVWFRIFPQGGIRSELVLV